MDQQYEILNLKEEQINEIKQLEGKIAAETGNSCVLIAYTDQSGAQNM